MLATNASIFVGQLRLLDCSPLANRASLILYYYYTNRPASKTAIKLVDLTYSSITDN